MPCGEIAACEMLRSLYRWLLLLANFYELMNYMYRVVLFLLRIIIVFNSGESELQNFIQVEPFNQ